jgi:peptidoglycan/xylan/chitin deacetylase (PgdA/CDA1 family)
MSWLISLAETLDAASQPIVFFFRNDDAGWEDRRLFELLRLFGKHDVPLDLAVIPKSIRNNTAARLRVLVEMFPEKISLHQHGYAHLNHEQDGRKSEFGDSRPGTLQLADITSGRQLLMDMFGPVVDPIFTPPWNRCTAMTATCLRAAGFTYLSRDVSAIPIDTGGLREVPVAIDWFKKRQGFRLAPSEIGAALSAAARARSAVGVMLHHAVMDHDEHTRLGEVLRLLSLHPHARCVLMRDVNGVTGKGETS